MRTITGSRRRTTWLAGSVFCGLCAAWLGGAHAADDVDAALVISVDVSSSVDEHRYQLQMQGIAKAFEDPNVVNAIINGPHGGILLAMVTFADRVKVAIPWTRISSRAEASAVAAKVRAIPHQEGNFTCVSGMLRTLADKVVTQIPLTATRVVIDVSGDGADDCNPEVPTKAVRDELVATGVTINGLPILEGREAATLEGWYRANVMGGTGSFVLPANGFADFGRAIREKFVVEISQFERRDNSRIVPTAITAARLNGYQNWACRRPPITDTGPCPTSGAF
jgi:uncharacterized protein DUF1194